MLYPRFIFQTDRDSGFKFEIDGIQDSDLGLQGPINSAIRDGREKYDTIRQIKATLLYTA